VPWQFHWLILLIWIISKSICMIHGFGKLMWMHRMQELDFADFNLRVKWRI